MASLLCLAKKIGKATGYLVWWIWKRWTYVNAVFVALWQAYCTELLKICFEIEHKHLQAEHQTKPSYEFTKLITKLKLSIRLLLKMCCPWHRHHEREDSEASSSRNSYEGISEVGLCTWFLSLSDCQRSAWVSSWSKLLPVGCLPPFTWTPSGDNFALGVWPEIEDRATICYFPGRIRRDSPSRM